MSAEKRCALMSRIRGRGTGSERALGAALDALGLVCEGQAPDLPGRPDFVFRDERVAVFVDGDFWHGWRFPAWRHKLSVKWKSKIELNRKRDQRVHRTLRRSGWRAVRVWEHQIESELQGCVARLRDCLTLTGS